MKENAEKKTENSSHTFDNQLRISEQTPIGDVLQAYTGNQSVTSSAEMPKKTNNTGLPDALKSGVENLSGYSMDDVRVHYNSSKPTQLKALAYTQGADIHVASGQEKHLAHEAWHVVQQKQGRVHPSTQLQGINMNDNEELEKEADVMGNEVIHFFDKYPKPFAKSRNYKKKSSSNFDIVQCLRLKTAPTVMIDIGTLSLFRLLDYYHRPDPDPDIYGVYFDAGDKVALRTRANIQYPIEYTAIHTLLGQPDVATAAAKRNIGVGVLLQQILANTQIRFVNGNLQGFEEWIAGTHLNLNVDNVLDKMNELRAAIGIIGNVNINESKIAGTFQTADIQHGLNGEEQTEVKTIRTPIKGYQDFTGQISAALGKFQNAPIGGANRYNVTIYASIDSKLLNGINTTVGGSNTRSTSIAFDTLIKTETVKRNSDNHILNTKIENQWEKFLEKLNTGIWVGSHRAHRINIVLENGVGRQFNRNILTNVWT